MDSSRPFRARWTFGAALLLALASAPLAGHAASVVDAPGRFYLTWNAPYGHPRAREERVVACGDSSRRDTLYVSFQTGRDSTELVSVDAEIRLWPAGGDTLSRHWWFESRSNPAHLLADFNPGELPGVDRIWESQGNGGVRTVSGPDTAFIRMVWAVRPQDFSVIRSGQTYVFARLLVPRPANPVVCAKPVCFELTFGRLGRSVGSTDIVLQGKRWASWNPGSGAPCAPRVRVARVQPWRPGTKR